MIETELLIVYKEKDEEFFKHIKGLIESKDDNEKGIVGVEDGTVRVMKCPEKTWLLHKANGRENKLPQKILFIGGIKGISLKNYSYNEHGIAYGPINQNHYAIAIDEKYQWDELDYTSFQLELKRLTNNASITEIDAFKGKERSKRNMKDNSPFASLGLLLPSAFIAAGVLYAKDAKEAIKNAKILRSQMLYFAVTKVYFEELDKFMKR